MNGCPPVAAACRAASATREIARALPRLIDGRFMARAAVWALVAFLAFGFVAAIIPNPVFGRSLAPEPFAIAVWILSAPLMGLIAATYGGAPSSATAGAATRGSGAGPVLPAVASVLPVAGSGQPSRVPAAGGDPGPGTTAAAIGGLAAFVAIGCPLCNKVALLLLGASGALTVFAPLQPLIGAASIAMLVATLAWRLRVLATGGSCTVPAPA
jgi:hypothetical protein